MTELVRLDSSRVAVTGIELPTPPPTRVYISGQLYRIAAPSVALPPIAQVAKLIFNWSIGAGRTARNIMYALIGAGGLTNDATALLTLAEAVKSAFVGSGSIPPSISIVGTLNSVTAKDCGGSSAVATTTSAPVSGTATGQCLPPQSAVCISWQVSASYRGGKPRTYLPAIPSSACATVGDSLVSSSYASSLEAAATHFMNAVDSLTYGGGATVSLGTVSYHHAHAVRPTPLFYKFLNASVHERLDSQRRRSGKESAFPVIP